MNNAKAYLILTTILIAFWGWVIFILKGIV
jgi:hypothetical protein